MTLPRFFESRFSQLSRPGSRRQFLRRSALALGGYGLASCGMRVGQSNQSISPSQSAKPPASAGDPKRLHIFTWANYIDDAMRKAFEEKTGIQVIVDIMESNEVMLAKLQAGGGNTYSVIYPSNYMVKELASKGMLLELDQSRLNAIGDLFPIHQNPAYDPNNRHSIPATWGTTGFAYRKSLLANPPQTWADLWSRRQEFDRRLTMLGDARESIGAALKSLGYSYNSNDPAQIEAAYQALVDLKPSLATFTTDAWRDQLFAGDLLLAMCYSSDAAAAASENPDIGFVVPQSGTSLWVDTMAIPRNAPNPEAAYAWLAMTLQPDLAAAAVQRLRFSTPSKTVFQKLAPELQQNPMLFPAEALLAKCEVITALGPTIDPLYDEYWTKLTAL
jgi:spermidine/putrescine transport system substrate-binding protein